MSETCKDQQFITKKKKPHEGGGTWQLDLKDHERTGNGIHPLQMDGCDHPVNCLYILCLFEDPREIL